MATGDFNQDGKQDLAVVDLADSTVSILLGNGDGTFQPLVSYAVGTVPDAVAVADFNGDGIPDLAVSNLFGNTVTILLGNGDGTVQPDGEYLVGLEPSGLATANLNGDGGADVAVANYSSNTVSVLLNLPVITPSRWATPAARRSASPALRSRAPIREISR